MGWFDEQLRARKQKDNVNFEDAFLGIAGAIIGRRLADALDEREAAISAVEAVLRYYHIQLKDNTVPESIDSIDERIEYIMRPYGIMRRTVELDEGWYKCAVGPMLGTLKDDGSVVALIPGKLSGYYFYNLRTGEKVNLNHRTEKLIDREAVCFYRPLPAKKLSIADLIIYMKNQLSVSDILKYVGMLAIVTGIGLLSPMFTKWLFGPVLESGSMSMLISLTVFIVCFSASRIMISTYQMLTSTRVEIKTGTAVEAAVMCRVLSMPPAFFKEYSSGELSQRVQYVKSLCSTLINTVLGTGLTSLFSLVYIGQIMSFAPSLVLPAVIIILTTVVMSVITTFAQMKITKERMQYAAKETGMSYATITGIQKIKLAGAEKRMFARWARLYAKKAEKEYNPPLFIKLSPVINMGIGLFGTLVLYYFALISSVSVADYYAFTASYGMVSAAFMSLASIAITIADIKPNFDMAKPLLETLPEISENKNVITNLTGNIELSNVSFRYKEGMPNVIDNLSLKIKQGEYVAIVGKTGCGKSTLLRLLLGFETPQKGAIYYDRRDITKIDLKSLRQKIGVVMQDGKLFSGDIYSNIVISAPQLTLKEAWEAAEIASLADDIRAMPMGMNTLICEGQGGISGGQKQRLMIARAVANKPRILMFDEATSALDNITQRRVSEAIDSLNCTRIVIAHRLSTIRHCDRIIVIDGGKIVEDGKYDELIAKQGYFAELVARQRLDVGQEGLE